MLSAVSYEELPWHIDPNERDLIPRSARRRMSATYQAAIPAAIANLSPAVPEATSARIDDLLIRLARFDEAQAARGYDLSALLLRSESAASSQIEHLTSSVRNVALAELSNEAPANARIVQGNVSAMREALRLPPDISVEQIKAIHRPLIEPTGASFGGELRDEQVWVGGTAYSPHGALFVPPSPARVEGCLEDLVAFVGRDDVSPIAKAAVAHAQFETIHPFIDGNGRTGRVLLHRILRSEGVLTRTTLPVSAGLLHDVGLEVRNCRARRLCHLASPPAAGRAARRDRRVCRGASGDHPARRLDPSREGVRVWDAASPGVAPTWRLLSERRAHRHPRGDIEYVGRSSHARTLRRGPSP